MATTYSFVRISHELPATALDIGQRSDTHMGLRGLLDFLVGVLSGIRHAVVEVAGGAVRAQAEITAGSANGTVVVNGVAVNGNGASAAARATDAITNLNASADALHAGLVFAQAGSATDKLLVISTMPGKNGNQITISVTGTGWSVTGGGARLTGGTESVKTYRRGL